MPTVSEALQIPWLKIISRVGNNMSPTTTQLLLIITSFAESRRDQFLGHFYFSYINDLPLSSPSSHFIIFADDTNILFSHKDPIQLENLINIELNEISNWFKLNKLSLNIDKTNFMIF